MSNIDEKEMERIWDKNYGHAEHVPSPDGGLRQFKCPTDGIFNAIGYDNPVFLADTVADCPECGEKCWEAQESKR
jgi:hypothetical protein